MGIVISNNNLKRQWVVKNDYIEPLQTERERREQEQARKELLSRYEPILDFYNPITKKFNIQGMWLKWSELLMCEDILHCKLKGCKTYNADAVIKANEIINKMIQFIEKGKVETMAKNSFRAVFNNTFNAYAIARMSILNAKEELADLERSVADAEHLKAVNPDAFTLVKAKYISRKAELEDIIADAKRTLAESKRENEKELEKLIQAKYSIKPGCIDDKTIKLLEMATLSLADIKGLVEDNKENYTMLKVLEKYARGYKDTQFDILANSIESMCKGREQTDYIDICNMLDRGISDDISRIRANADAVESQRENILARVSNAEIDITD